MDNLDYQKKYLKYKKKYLDLNGKLQFSGASLNSNNREPEIFFNKGTAAAISELKIEESPNCSINFRLVIRWNIFSNF